MPTFFAGWTDISTPHSIALIFIFYGIPILILWLVVKVVLGLFGRSDGDYDGSSNPNYNLSPASPHVRRDTDLDKQPLKQKRRLKAWQVTAIIVGVIFGVMNIVGMIIYTVLIVQARP